MRNTKKMNNRLEVPRSVITEIKTVFGDKKRAMSANWFLYSVIFGLAWAILILSAMWFFLEGVDEFIIMFSAFIGFVMFLFTAWTTHSYREKIIADMKSAKQIFCQYHFDYRDAEGGHAHANIIPTMAGNVIFISIQSPEMGITKKLGKIFDYYVYDVVNINEKNLGKFIAI